MRNETQKSRREEVNDTDTTQESPNTWSGAGELFKQVAFVHGEEILEHLPFLIDKCAFLEALPKWPLSWYKVMKMHPRLASNLTFVAEFRQQDPQIVLAATRFLLIEQPVTQPIHAPFEHLMSWEELMHGANDRSHPHQQSATLPRDFVTYHKQEEAAKVLGPLVFALPIDRTLWVSGRHQVGLERRSKELLSHFMSSIPAPLAAKMCLGCGGDVSEFEKVGIKLRHYIRDNRDMRRYCLECAKQWVKGMIRECFPSTARQSANLYSVQ